MTGTDRRFSGYCPLIEHPVFGKVMSPQRYSLGSSDDEKQYNIGARHRGRPGSERRKREKRRVRRWRVSLVIVQDVEFSFYYSAAYIFSWKIEEYSLYDFYDGVDDD